MTLPYPRNAALLRRRVSRAYIAVRIMCLQDRDTRFVDTYHKFTYIIYSFLIDESVVYLLTSVEFPILKLLERNITYFFYKTLIYMYAISREGASSAWPRVKITLIHSSQTDLDEAAINE